MWWLPSDGSHKDKEDLLIKQSALLGVALGCGNGPAGDQGYKSISAVLSLFLMPLLPLSFLSLLFLLLTWMPRCLTAEKTLSHVPAGLQMAEDWLWWDFQFFHQGQEFHDSYFLFIPITIDHLIIIFHLQGGNRGQLYQCDTHGTVLDR